MAQFTPSPSQEGWAPNIPHMETLERGNTDVSLLVADTREREAYLNHCDYIPPLFMLGRNK